MTSNCLKLEAEWYNHLDPGSMGKPVPTYDNAMKPFHHTFTLLSYCLCRKKIYAPCFLPSLRISGPLTTSTRILLTGSIFAHAVCRQKLAACVLLKLRIFRVCILFMTAREWNPLSLNPVVNLLAFLIPQVRS